MLREDKKKLLSLGVVIALLAGTLLCMNFTPAGEKLFDIDPDQVDQVVFSLRAVWGHRRPGGPSKRWWTTSTATGTTGNPPGHGAPLPTKTVSLVLGEEYLNVSFNHMGVWRENEDGTTTVYSSYSWMDYFEPLVHY